MNERTDAARQPCSHSWPLAWDRPPLLGRTALVTGGAERVGAYICRALAAAGADVAINHLDEANAADETAKNVQAAGRRAAVIQANIAIPDQARRMVGQAVSELGRLDLVVHNASTYVSRPFLDLTPDDLEMSLGAIVKGPLWVSQAAVQAMGDKGGKLIAIIGNSITEAWPNFTTHSIAKAGLKRMMEILAVELAPTIQCLCICPGQLIPGQDSGGDVRARRGERREDPLVTMPDGVRFYAGQPQDLADSVVLLASSPSYLNGASLTLDGGRGLY